MARPGSTDDAISWWQTSADQRPPRPPLDGDVDVDVVVVGAGFTGLWAAYYLAMADPSLRIVVVEREVVGFGASGRNGGWCVGSLAATHRAYERAQTGGALRMVRAIQATVDEVGHVATAQGIDCHFAKGGTIYPAATDGQLQRLREVVEQAHAIGQSDDDYRLLTTPAAVKEHLNVDCVGGVFTPHCAALQPYLLAVGLADAIERLGVVIHERTPATSVSERRVETTHGTVRADIVIVATEAYTSQLPGHERDLIPLHNNMVVTAPLPPEAWDHIGLANRQTFEDGRHMIYYGQRTVDDRIAIGGLSAIYRYGSTVSRGTELHRQTHRRLERLLATLFPSIPMTVEYRWGGVLGVPRDFFPSVGYQPTTGWAWATGYVGQGVAAANLAGRTLTALITDPSHDLASLPWANHVSRPWEPEPLRWLGVKATAAALHTADAADLRGMPVANRVADAIVKAIT